MTTSPHPRPKPLLDRITGRCLWLCFRLLPTAIALLLSALLLSASVSRAQEALPEAGAMELHSAGQAPLPALLQHSELDMQIAGMVAVVTLQQTFRNTSGHWAEAVYTFPLPDEAAVRHLEMQVGERRIVGEIRERQAAEKTYQEARAAGKKASLVAQQRPNLFSNRVANVAPGEEVSVRLEWVQRADYADGEFSLRVPMTLTPRYMPGQPSPPAGPEDSGELVPLGWARATDQVPDAAAISPWQHAAPGSDHTPLNPVTITVELDAGMPLARVGADYHELSLRRDANRYRLRLTAGVAEMDRDFVLKWAPATGSRPRAALFTEQVGEAHYGLLLVVPPALTGDLQVVPRELVFVVDTSGSMGGVSIEQARQSLATALRQLRPEDRFNIIAFDSDYRALYDRAMPASRHHLQQAQEFVRQLRASGGTEMLAPLQHALNTAAAMTEESEHLRQIIFITDGAVGNEQAVVDAIARGIGRNRLFTVGIGAAPNSWFMRKAAQLGRGMHLHIGELEEVSAGMDTLFRYLSAPLVTDIAIDWPAAVAAAAGPVPDLYQGAPLLRAVRFEAPPRGARFWSAASWVGSPGSNAYACPRVVPCPGPASAVCGPVGGSNSCWISATRGATTAQSAPRYCRWRWRTGC
ncbi:marine proteobacterial sortase target protein [Kineobactrum salinum]|uniref:Marine proteobacterial sortase target protein n=1 Tax=Kineobactrum salinum TaxID=2708301 RepID=A0A6C0TYN8_9GAMM|nr:marine proteobacterial sortase target protein [Kineobactrum salinum]QIB64653.1 marine proteobacterial sortase target protein [Kineobactrum salinum]